MIHFPGLFDELKLKKNSFNLKWICVYTTNAFNATFDHFTVSLLNNFSFY